MAKKALQQRASASKCSQQLEEQTAIEWVSENVFRLLDLFEQRPCLWLIKNPDYHKQTLREAAYKEIAEALSAPFTGLFFFHWSLCISSQKVNLSKGFGFLVKAVKDKIHNLRVQFNRELNKERQTRRTGDGTEDTYTSSWAYFERMQFLRDSCTARDSISNLPSPLQLNSSVASPSIDSDTVNFLNIITKILQALLTILRVNYDNNQLLSQYMRLKSLFTRMNKVWICTKVAPTRRMAV